MKNMRFLGSWYRRVLLKLLCVGVIAFLIRQTLQKVIEGTHEDVTVVNPGEGTVHDVNFGGWEGTVHDVNFGSSWNGTKDHFKDRGSWKGTKYGVYTGGSKDVMITAYMRSGSSFLGRVLGFRSDTFYVYEPLFSVTIMEYFSSESQKCGTFRPYCTKSSGLKTAFEALNQLYDCTFYSKPMLELLKFNISVEQSGKRWDVYKACKENGSSDITCLTVMATKVCATSKYKVTKVLRISLPNIASFLQSRQGMKVVHLFRDPRAIINSHLNTWWSMASKESLESIEAAAKSICQRIRDDLKYVAVLQEQFPERFLPLQYEDFDEALPKIRKLFHFLGMDFTKEVLKFIDKSNKTSSSGYYPFLYREQLEWRMVMIINTQCRNVFEQLGYKMFTSEDTFRNLSIPAVIYPLPFALL